MRPITLLSAFSREEFHNLCTVIIQSHIAESDLDNPMRYTCPIHPIINLTANSVHLRTVEGCTFNYNIMSHDATPGDSASYIIDDVFLFQVHYFNTHPTTQQGCLDLLRSTLLTSLETIFRYISATSHRSDFHNVDYVFLSNLEFDLTSIDYSRWITDALEARHPNVNFQIGTSVSILSALNAVDSVRSCYYEIVRKNSAVIILPSSEGVKAVAFDSLGLTRLVDDPGNTPFNVLAKSSARVREIDDAFEQFNQLLADSSISEEEFHRFFMEHPIFLTGLSYKTIRSKIVLEREGAGPLIPDFFLEPTTTRLWDIVDIKLPRAKVWAHKKNRDRFSCNVYEAVAQLREYGNYFDDPAHRKLIETRYAISCYKPRLIAVIGSRRLVDEYAFRNAHGDLSSVTIRTFDDLVAEVQNIREWLAKG